MERLHPVLRRAAHLTLGASLATILAAQVHASEVNATCDASGLVIHGPAETFKRYCLEQDGRLWLTLPGGARYELVTSTSDPAIANPGDGSFHPFEETQVRAALAAVRYPVASVNADVFLLPFPRRDGLESAAGPGLILLSPGVRPLSVQQQHAEFIHELGHVVQYSRIPDADTDGWSHYRELRGISDATVYNASAPHADRPHEIFAEDFRALFGGDLANYSGTIENAQLPAPATVAGLSDFMRDLAGATAAWAGTALACYPNPSIDAVSFARGTGAAVALDVYDVAGRRLATLQPTAGIGVTTWRWDGRDLTGAPVGPGVFFARARDGHGILRVTRIR